MIKKMPFYAARILVTGLVSLALLAGASPAGATDRIGFINIEKAMAGTQEWKKEFESFKADFQKEKNMISAREEKLKKMFEEIQKQGFVLDPKLKKEKEDKFREEKKEFERYVQDKNEEFGRKEKAITDNMMKKMVTVIRKIGQEKKLTMIVDQRSVIYFAPENDLTDQVISMYDKSVK